MPLPAWPYDNVFRIVQTIFYAAGTILAILTYRAARHGLLNSVNTEYQKRVMDRLHKLSEDLYSEFDPESPNYWCKGGRFAEAVQEIKDEFLANKEEILQDRKFEIAVTVPPEELHFQALLEPIRSDPFMPEQIRQAVLTLLDTRIQVGRDIRISELEAYALRLAKGKPLTDDDAFIVHNAINREEYLRGCGVAQIEDDVHEIRALIQDYFDQFNPHRRWWHGKRDRPKRKYRKA